MKQEGYGGIDDVRLRTSMVVPKSAIGRIIGKSGKNVKDIQHSTGAIIKLLSKVDIALPFQVDKSAGPASVSSEDSSSSGVKDTVTDTDDVIVDVYGNFLATQVSSRVVISLWELTYLCVN